VLAASVRVGGQIVMLGLVGLGAGMDTRATSKTALAV
jgi:hypothetical protein